MWGHIQNISKNGTPDEKVTTEIEFGELLLEIDEFLYGKERAEDSKEVIDFLFPKKEKVVDSEEEIESTDIRVHRRVVS